MATVTILSFIERLFGFIYRIFLSRTLGSEGVGIYQIALSVVGLLITLTASGIPITVSRIMIKNRTENFKDNSGSVVFAG
ncbi:MAG: oligosaccharide flippase family protein, partial [Clostridia bacterium]|nr:oligosaccharide flippase family protein [Clostridia bacterium]